MSVRDVVLHEEASTTVSSRCRADRKAARKKIECDVSVIFRYTSHDLIQRVGLTVRRVSNDRTAADCRRRVDPLLTRVEVVSSAEA